MPEAVGASSVLAKRAPRATGSPFERTSWRRRRRSAAVCGGLRALEQQPRRPSAKHALSPPKVSAHQKSSRRDR